MADTKQTPTSALVLGGGGTTGIAWETGLLLGLLAGGVDVSKPDLIVGTSAGSTVGAQLSSGLDLEQLYARQLRPLAETGEQVVAFDLDLLMLVFAAGMGAPDAQTGRARVGAAALATQTMPEAERLQIIAARLPSQEWSTTQKLIIPAVNARTGEVVLFDQHSGVPLVLAVAASCAVPGVYPPVTIQDQRYIDGGVRSGTNADLASGHQRVLIVQVEAFDDALDGEQTELEKGGSSVLILKPDTASAEARGPNALDASRCPAAAQAGRTQGLHIAEQVKTFWYA